MKKQETGYRFNDILFDSDFNISARLFLFILFPESIWLLISDNTSDTSNNIS